MAALSSCTGGRGQALPDNHAKRLHLFLKADAAYGVCLLGLSAAVADLPLPFWWICSAAVGVWNPRPATAGAWRSAPLHTV